MHLKINVFFNTLKVPSTSYIRIICAYQYDTVNLSNQFYSCTSLDKNNNHHYNNHPNILLTKLKEKEKR